MKHPFCHSAKRPFFHSSFSSNQTGAISEARFLNSEELSRIKSSSLYLSSCPGRRGINSTQLFGPMSSSKISPLYCRLALNEIRQSNSSDDLCLLFCLMVQSLINIYIYIYFNGQELQRLVQQPEQPAVGQEPLTPQPLPTRTV